MSSHCRRRLQLALTLLALAASVIANTALASTPGAETRALIEELELSAAPQPISKTPGWRPRKVVVMTLPPMGMAGAEYEQALRAAAGDTVELVIVPQNKLPLDRAALTGVDAVIGLCSAEVLRNTDTTLRWFHSYSVGVDHCAGEAAKLSQQVTFSNNKRLSAPAIAEHSIAMLLALTHNLPAYAHAQAEANWNRALAADVTFGELKGKTLLVAGLGGIGTEIAWRAHGLGMRVIATRHSGRHGPDYVDYVGLPQELHKLAAQADVVANALPLTAETTGVFNAAFFAALKPGAIFLSVGRGKSTVTPDLVATLQSGRLWGAGLDVTDPEPLPADHPLWQLPRVLITPHVSAAGDDTDRRSRLIAVENLRRYVAGEALLNVVDMTAGY